jgi:hypothetical protein
MRSQETLDWADGSSRRRTYSVAIEIFHRFPEFDNLFQTQLQSRLTILCARLDLSLLKGQTLIAMRSALWAPPAMTSGLKNTHEKVMEKERGDYSTGGITHSSLIGSAGFVKRPHRHHSLN